MIVHVHVLCFNEEILIPYFLQNYSFADKIIIYDHESDDNSLDLLSDKVEVKTYSTGGEIRDDIWIDIKNNCWKTSRGEADFVIVCDMDEFLFHPHIKEFLSFTKQMGFSLFQPVGYQMVGYPPDKKGVELPSRHKQVLFDPNKIEEINYLPGAHECNPEGIIKLWKTRDLSLLHYKWLNLDYVIKKYSKYSKRLSDINKENGWSHHYLLKREELTRYYKNLKIIAKEIK